MKQILLPTALLAFACGCQSTINTVSNANEPDPQTVVSDRRVVTDAFLRSRLIVKNVRLVEAPGGCLKAQVEAFNARISWFSQLWSGMTGENPYPIDYRFVWMDASGMVVDVPGNCVRQRVEVIPGGTVLFQSVAPTPACRTFTLELKEAN